MKYEEASSLNKELEDYKERAILAFREFYKAMYSKELGKYADIEITDFIPEGLNLVHQTYSCGESNYDYYIVPRQVMDLEWTTADWINDQKAKQAKEEEERQREIEEEKARKAKIDKEARRKTYEILKKEFES